MNKLFGILITGGLLTLASQAQAQVVAPSPATRPAATPQNAPTEPAPQAQPPVVNTPPPAPEKAQKQQEKARENLAREREKALKDAEKADRRGNPHR